MKQLNIYDAKTQLSHLIHLVSKGEMFVIAKAGTPVAKLTPIFFKQNKFKFGVMSGKIKLAPDFDAPLSEDVIELFESTLKK